MGRVAKEMFKIPGEIKWQMGSSVNGQIKDILHLRYHQQQLLYIFRNMFLLLEPVPYEEVDLIYWDYSSQSIIQRDYSYEHNK